MSLDGIWKPYGLQLETENISGQICGITNYSIPDNIQVDRPNVDGSPYSTITRVMSREELINLTTLNVDSAVNLIGVGAQCLQAEALQFVRFWLARWDQCSNRPVVGNFHRYYGMNGSNPMAVRGQITLESIQCNNLQDATAQVKIDCLADKNADLTYAIEEGIDQALPAGLADNGQRYTLGKMTVAGVLIAAKTGFDIATNAQIERIPVDSEIAAKYAHMADHKSIITIRGIDPNWAVPKTGLICTHANTRLYLRRRGETAGVDFEPNNQTKHLLFTAKGRAFKTQLAGGAANAPSETVLVIYPEYDPVSTMVPIVGLTGQTIT